MQFGKSLLGAIIGAAIGIALLLVVYLTMGIDKVWLSIPFAIITGLGVRMFVSTGGHASYVRGAMTMVVALAGYIGGWMLVEKVVSARANATGKAPPIAGEEKQAVEPGDTEAKDAEGKDADAQDAEGQDAVASDENSDTAATDEEKDADAAPKAAPPKAAPLKRETAMPRATTPRAVAYTPWDVICLAVAALVAYELGRGSGMSPAGSSSQSAPGGTHPDA
jgi:hypothetical protein